MKKTVYLDATVPSYLYDERESIQTYIAVNNPRLKPVGFSLTHHR